MSFGERFLVFSCLVCAIGCTQLNNGTVADENRKSSRKSRVLTSYAGLVTCAVKYDADCFIDAAQEYLEDERTDLLAEADAAAYRATGRSDPESKPSHLVDVIGKLITELSKMFEGGFSGFFKSARENDEEDDKNILEEGENDTARANGEFREYNVKKKKSSKKPLKSVLRLVKVALIVGIVVLKIAVVLKVLQTAMQFKFLLISAGGFAIQAAKLWMNLRNNKNEHHEEIVYKNPYSSGGEEWQGGPGGPPGVYNARSIREVHELVYGRHKPVAT
ncbi:uncharacterized protein LOC132708155 isoform X3 [Cylas formicarius]|uniref:uncharacterized protein LOC132708155 isoform X3 n=1 Tax=Cylas formicarius TaxID=197179 RepID=UPI002958AC69|nr:uncharacterized protein LOC132708155 isoform X3 [Cylas formicarius]